MSNPPQIAIVGMSGLYPAAASPEALWSNILARVDAAGEPPPGRWALPVEKALAPGRIEIDRVPSGRACFLEPFQPDLTGLDIDPALVARLDPVFHLALTIGGRAWRSAVTHSL